MQSATMPLTRDLVLIGGGHCHALVLRRWAMAPLPGVRVTLVNPGPTAPYSGMLPGFVAGHYSRAELDIDLVRLARRAGARLVLGRAEGIDRQRGMIAVSGHPALGYDLAAIDIGITSATPELPGFSEHAVPAKPLGLFADAWAAYLGRSGPADVAVIGAGVAGAELAMAMAHALLTAGRHPIRVNLIDRSDALAAVRPATAKKLRHALHALGISLIETATITRISQEGVHLRDGRLIGADFVTGAAGARPQDWLTESGLRLTDGFVDVDAMLRSSDPRIYATGDCAHMVDSPRPKAGVYAVRQAPVLYDNLCRQLRGQDPLRRYRAQADYLKLISLGGRSALAERWGMAPSGRLMWRWKDRIDQSFMRKFHDLPEMTPPALPEPRAAGLEEVQNGKPLCGGCGAKVGQGALAGALAALHPVGRGDVLRPPGDDAAVLQSGAARQVLSTDHLRGFVEDPAVMARIAAVHALGDIWAMGARPQAALVQVVLPRMAPALAERSLREITEAAQQVFAADGAEILGGHSSLGAEMTLGFTVTGLCDGDPITLAGARPGDGLYLTKPIGTGVIMAAEMALQASGAVVAMAIDSMTTAQGRESAALVAAGVRAMTDVTGFGLYGHIANICRASGCGAELWCAKVPLLAGAEALSAAGQRSSLFAENRAFCPDPRRDPASDLLFDPQTAGGLLAAVPGPPERILAEFAARDLRIWHVGTIIDGPVGTVVLH